MGARHLLATDLPAAAGTLATAFVDDPTMRWITGQPEGQGDTARLAGGFFEQVVRAGLRRGHLYGVDGPDGLAAVALWIPPDVSPFVRAEGIALATALQEAYGPEAVERMIVFDRMSKERRPDEPHFYLLELGAAVPGTGVGARAAAPVLDRCDADGLPAYLESSNPRNVGFYARLGFESVWQERPADDAPLLTGMWRPPAT